MFEWCDTYNAPSTILFNCCFNLATSKYQIHAQQIKNGTTAVWKTKELLDDEFDDDDDDVFVVWLTEERRLD